MLDKTTIKFLKYLIQKSKITRIEFFDYFECNTKFKKYKTIV